MNRLGKLVVFGLVCGLLGGCTASTKMLTTWKDPEANNVRFTKILVLAATKNDPLRRSLETAVAREVDAGQVSYNTIPTDDLDDVTKVKAKVEASGCDGFVVVRIRDVDRDVKVTQSGSGYGGYGAWGYWGTPGYTAYSSTRVSTDTKVTVETNVYEVSTAKLIWTSRSKTSNPDDVKDLIESIAKANREEMREQGLLAPKPDK